MKKKMLLDYLSMVMISLGACALILGVLTATLGDRLKPISTMFALGSAGIPLRVLFQYLGLLMIIAALRWLLFREDVQHRLPSGARTVYMVAAAAGCAIVFILVFGWFPADMWQAWLGFGVSFAVCFGAGWGASEIRQRWETRRLEAALQHLKNPKGDGHDQDH